MHLDVLNMCENVFVPIHEYVFFKPVCVCIPFNVCVYEKICLCVYIFVHACS